MDNGDDTFLDEIYKHLSSNNNINKNNNSLINSLINIIELDEYDTDSIDIDLDIYKKHGVSNISLKLGDDIIVNKMIQRLNKSKSYI